MSAAEPPRKGAAGDLLRLLFRAHPWHGVALGPEAPARVTAYVEIVPTDTVKYEIDKPSGILKVDRPQQFSNVCPTLYGFLPQTYCGERVAALARSGSGPAAASGDGDPLDVCVLTEKSFSHGDVLLQAVPVGGLRLLDRGQADDKIVAVLFGDAAFGHLREIEELPEALLARLRHYFLTYKRPPGAERAEQEILQTYGRAAAYEVIERSREDYRELHPGLEERLARLLLETEREEGA
jgi:inorganic pyrophosphatase